MNIIDIIILIPIVIGFILGISKGLIKELSSLVGIVIGIFGSKFLAPPVAKLLVSWFNLSESLAMPLSFILLFAVFIVLLIIVSNILDKMLNAIELGGINKFFGGIFGAVKIALVISVLFNLFDAINSRIPIVNHELTEKSFSYKPIINFGPKLWDEFQTKQSDSANHNHIK